MADPTKDLVEPRIIHHWHDHETTPSSRDLPIRNERRDERMHIRVRLPFHVTIGRKKYAGRDISVSGLSTADRTNVDEGRSVQCEISVRCNGFRATLPVTLRALDSRRDQEFQRFEIVDIAHAEAGILQRLIHARLSGVHLTLDQLAATEDSQTVRNRVKTAIDPPKATSSLVRFVGTLAVIGVLILGLGAALFERLFVIQPNFAAVTAPEIKIFAPADGDLAPHEHDPGDVVKRDQPLIRIEDREAKAQLVLARATLKYNENLIANLRESMKKGKGGSVTITTGGPESGSAPAIVKLTPLQVRTRIKELETALLFTKAKVRALEARMANRTIYSPCDCIVYSMRSGDGGYWVQKGSLIAKLIESNPKYIKVEALVHLNEISRIEPNDRAEVILPTTGESLGARVTAIQLDSQNIERAGFPQWARQDMSHGSVILAMEDPLPPSLVGHPVEVRFIDTDSLGGRSLAYLFQLANDLMRWVTEPITAAVTQRSLKSDPRQDTNVRQRAGHREIRRNRKGLE
jgi:multidrug resistance efflux pump